MPEGIEIEMYRRAAAATVGRTIATLEITDPRYPRHGVAAETIAAAAAGAEVCAVRRVGKLLLMDLDTATLGLRFGMTGRLIVDDAAPIERLEYSSGRDDPAWDRLVMTFTDGGSLRIRDQRRLGSIELDPDETLLGPDAAGIDAATLADVLAGSSRPLKGRLLDQHAIAGLGNLLCDEICWRAGVHPSTPADELGPAEVATLAETIRSTFAELTERGGSHTGDLQSERHRDGRCPIDGTRLERHALAGRTTYACPVHQRRREGKW